MRDEDIQKTQEQLKAADSKVADPNKRDRAGSENGEKPDQLEADQESQVDLVDDYQRFLEDRREQPQLRAVEEDKMEVDQLSSEEEPRGQPPLTDFDYQAEKLTNRALYEQWRADEDVCQRSIALLSRFKAETSQASASLCEQLRIVLEPQLSQQLQGDYRTGKRLNMKKVISFIASHYRNDKIWLRRTLPSKRDYKILIAIDDSLSMKEQNLGFFSLEAMVTLIEALNRLEVGKVAVARIRDRMELL